MWKTSRDVLKKQKAIYLFRNLSCKAYFIQQFIIGRNESKWWTMLWTYYEHIRNTCFRSKFSAGIPKRIIILFPRYLICYIIPQRFNLFRCIKPKTYLNHWSWKKVVRCLIRYASTGLWLRLKYLQIIMRQCTVKPAWIGHALKRRPCWEGQTRLIPSVYYLLPFHASWTQKS